MKAFVLLFSLCFGHFAGASSDQDISKQLNKEFSRLYRQVQTFEKTEMVGDYLYTRKFSDYEVLWRLADEISYDVIRIYRERSDGSALDLSYFRSPHIVPERLVLRRFVGPSGSGWRNDTIDAETGEYLGRQGVIHPELDARDREILKIWGIKLFD